MKGGLFSEAAPAHPHSTILLLVYLIRNWWMERNSVLIIGGGAAGLAAAHYLSKNSVAVTVLEARDRLGGRIHTTSSQTGDLPIELGAEFIHGKKNLTWDFIHDARLQTQEVPDRQWESLDGTLSETSKFWEALEKVHNKIDPRAPDMDFGSFLDQVKDVGAEAKRLAVEYVEGFHAAETGRIGVHALAKAESASEKEDGTHQFRVADGYSQLVDWFAEQLASLDVETCLKTEVRLIRWRPGSVELEAQVCGVWRRFSAQCALITLPLGVLQDKGDKAVRFEPPIAEKEIAVASLAMGAVSKMTLQFRVRFWPVENFGFIHSDDRWWPTWWADERGLLLTGWAGGPRAQLLERESRDEVLSRAISALSRLFKVEIGRIKDLLIASYAHDWGQDPFSRGAYSYTPAGMSDMPAKLAEPVAGTLFFAGEATDSRGDQGTVHGALESGLRAGKEIVDCLRAGGLHTARADHKRTGKPARSR